MREEEWQIESKREHPIGVQRRPLGSVNQPRASEKLGAAGYMVQQRMEPGSSRVSGRGLPAHPISRRRNLAYLALATGSIPLFWIASAARGEARNAINRLAPSTSPEPATMAAENTWGNWMSCERLPA